MHANDHRYFLWPQEMPIRPEVGRMFSQDGELIGRITAVMTKEERGGDWLIAVERTTKPMLAADGWQTLPPELI